MNAGSISTHVILFARRNMDFSVGSRENLFFFFRSTVLQTIPRHPSKPTMHRLHFFTGRKYFIALGKQIFCKMDQENAAKHSTNQRIGYALPISFYTTNMIHSCGDTVKPLILVQHTPCICTVVLHLSLTIPHYDSNSSSSKEQENNDSPTNHTIASRFYHQERRARAGI